MRLLKSKGGAVAIGYIMGAWVYGLIHVVSSAGQYSYIAGDVWSLLGRSLAWPYHVVLAVL